MPCKQYVITVFDTPGFAPTVFEREEQARDCGAQAQGPADTPTEAAEPTGTRQRAQTPDVGVLIPPSLVDELFRTVDARIDDLDDFIADEGDDRHKGAMLLERADLADIRDLAEHYLEGKDN